jgi:hypothetical protein
VVSMAGSGGAGGAPARFAASPTVA